MACLTTGDSAYSPVSGESAVFRDLSDFKHSIVGAALVIIDDVTSEVARIRAEHASEPQASLFCAPALPLTMRAALSVQPSEKFTKISKIRSIY